VQKLLALACLVLMACGGSVASAPGEPVDSGAPQDARIERSEDRDGGVTTTKACPAEAASTQEVKFAITNGASSDRWIVLRGAFCTAYSIDRLAIEMGFQCGCECPNPGSPRVETYRRIAPGTTYELTWDARALVTCEEPLDCSEWGPSTTPQKTTRGFLQPVKAGTYTATIAFEESLPSRCTVSGDDANCSWTYGGYTGSLPGAIASRCEATKTVNATVTLATSGDVVVPVTLK